MAICPNCGAGLRFDIKSQRLHCDNCDTVLRLTNEVKTTGAEEKEFEVMTFSCPQCGGEIVSQDHTAAAFCSYCGASVILKSRLSKEMRPDKIIPFRIAKEDCIDAYRKRMKRAFFAPDDLKDEKCIDGFRGIYMPYWIFQVTQCGTFEFKAEKERREGDYLITEHYKLEAEIDADYLGMTHDAAEEFDDDISEGLAPYDMQVMRPFQEAYLSGFYADTKSVDASPFRRQALQFANRISLRNAREQWQGRTFSIQDPDLSDEVFFHSVIREPLYGLFPVWFMSYRKGNRVAYVTINGQTGKISADIPIAFPKFLLGSLLLSGPVFLLIQFFLSLNVTWIMFLSMICAVIALGITSLERQAIKNREPQRKEPVWKRLLSDYSSLMVTLAATVIGLLCLNNHPSDDRYYYSGSFMIIGAIGYTMYDVIRKYNLLAMRRLPQFDRTGGNDDAK